MPINVGTTELCTIGDVSVGSQNSLEVYAGADKVFPCDTPPSQCFSFDESKICIPFANAGFVGGVANGPWYLTLEFNSATPDNENIALFEEDPDCADNCGFSSSLDFSAGFWQQFPFRLGITIGQSASANPTGVNIENGDWVRLSVGYDGVTDDIHVLWDNLTKDLQKTGYHGIMNPSELTAPSAQLCLGSATQWTIRLFSGQMRNVTLEQNSVVLGDWPIQGQTLDDGTILDVSGNNNHGTVSVAGNGTWGPCP